MKVQALITVAGAVIIAGAVYWVAINKYIITPPQLSPSPEVKVADNINQEKNMDVTELKIEDIKVGTGKEVKSGDTVIIHYSGTLLNGTKFDSSYDRNKPFETKIGVGEVIEGWDKGVVGMRVGGKRKLTIPSAMGYGTRGAGAAIPPNAGLVFDVELVEIK